MFRFLTFCRRSLFVCLQEPEADGQGRLWTPGVIEMFRFLQQQVQLAAGVKDDEVMRNLAAVVLQVMQRCAISTWFGSIHPCCQRSDGELLRAVTCAV